MKRKALVLVFSNLKHDARVNRQIKFLSQHFTVTVVAFDSEEKPDIELIKITQTPLTLITKLKMAFWLGLRVYSKAYTAFHGYQKTTKALASRNWDLIVANDIDTLPMAFEIKASNSTKIIFDAHEYAPRHFENRLTWRLFIQPFYIYLCKKYIPLTDEMLTVGIGLADEYERNFGKRATIITNAPAYTLIDITEPENNKIKLVHHGIANPSRRLELMYDMMHHLDDRFTLDLILLTSDFASGSTKNYIDNLKAKLATDPRIKVLPPVKSSDVVKTINKYDIGIFLLPPVNFNYENALPNKLFDFIQARLAVGIGPSKEMATIVNKYELGVVSGSFEAQDLAQQLSAITPERLSIFKQNAAKAASELCAESNDAKMLDIINKLFH